ncbi:MAG: DUF5715 family protein [Bacteroidales bacterium]|jgi:hypothetical protein
MNRILKISIIVILTFLLALSAYYIFSPNDQNRGFRYFVNNKVGKKCSPYPQAIYSRRLRDKITDYIGLSSSSGIPRCKSREELMKFVSDGRLYKIHNGTGYKVEDLFYSYPYLTKDGKDLLTEVGRRFRNKVAGTGLRGSDFRITSMTRTTEIVRQLRSSNSNASENSPHFNGNTFDLSYVRFSSPKCFITDCDKYFLKESLAEVIWQLRQENRCWATYELKQGCFHVVAR